MKNFMVIYHAPVSAMQQTGQASPEEMQKGIELWMNWAKKCGDQMVDMGNPLMGGQAINPDGSSTPSTKDVCGYSILRAENIEEAKKLLEGHPHLGWNAACSIEIHESLPVPGS